MTATVLAAQPPAGVGAAPAPLTPAGTTWHGAAFRGAMRGHRARLRTEAVTRNAATPHEWTRAHRESRCACPAPGLSVVPGVCPWPWKDRFASRQEAAHKYARLPRWRRVQGLRPYRCPAGDHWHLGRAFRRAYLAWRSAA